MSELRQHAALLRAIANGESEAESADDILALRNLADLLDRSAELVEGAVWKNIEALQKPMFAIDRKRAFERLKQDLIALVVRLAAEAPKANG